MTTASHQIVQLLVHLVKVVPVGTNLALLQLMWAMVSGAFLRSRGAVHSALQLAGFSPGEVRRSWQALRYGVWSNDELLSRWRAWVTAETRWQPHSYEGWQPVAIDITAFWRPRLQGWVGRYFHQLAQRLLPAVAFAIVAEVGQNAGQRVPLLRHVLRGANAAGTTAELTQRLLAWVRRYLTREQVAVFDAGFKLQQIQEAGVPRFVLRLAKNCTIRRHAVPAGQRRGRPRSYGDLLRPLPRRYRGRSLAASPADHNGTFVVAAEDGTEVTVAFLYSQFHIFFDVAPANLMRSRIGEDQGQTRVSYLRWSAAATLEMSCGTQPLHGISEYIRIRPAKYGELSDS